MKPNGTVEYNSLSWVKSQLDAVISDAQSSLSEYIENNDDALMQDCIEGLRLVYGTLQMVEIFGAAMLAEEMETTARAILEDKVDDREDAYDVLMRALLQLPDYLEGLQSGKKDTPIVLLPLMNDMRAICKQSLLSENVLFFPDMDAVEIEEQEIEAPVIEPSRLQAEAKRLRTHYQLGLLDLLKNNKQHAGYQRMLAVIVALRKASTDQSVRRYWHVIAALLEGLLDEGIAINVSIKMLLGHVDRQIKLAIEIGEENFTTRYSQELLKNLLYYIAHSDSSGKRVNEVREIYKLDELMSHAAEGEESSLGGLNAELFETVSKGIKEDLAQVKDTLELFIHSSERNVAELAPLTEQLLRIGDTYGMLGLGDARQKVLEQKDKVSSIAEGRTEASEDVVFGIAADLLVAEADFRERFHLKVRYADAARTFLSRLRGADDPERKRKIIGETFIEVFEREAQACGDVRFLAQGTIYPDRIESASVHGPSATIKTHHNVGGLPERMHLELVEPLRDLFKDEVRKVGEALGLDHSFVQRHPFPGPGLAVRILGEVTAERVALLQEADDVFITELRRTGLYEKTAQAFVVLLPVRTVGVMGDGRTYEHVVALRAVETTDFMTADWARLPAEFLSRVASRIVNEVTGINRVVYDITSKPPGTIEWE